MRIAPSLAGLLVLITIQSSWQVPDQDLDQDTYLLSEDTRFDDPGKPPNMKRHSEGTFSNDVSVAQEYKTVEYLVNLLKNAERDDLLSKDIPLEDVVVPPKKKRHSEGTFSNDYSKYLEAIRAQDFVQWLKNSKRSVRHADGTYTSDVSSYRQDQAAKEFVSWLKAGRGRRE